MRTDNLVRVDAINILLANLGEVDTERFISLIKRDTFDYTEWRHSLFENQSIQEIHDLAAEYEKKNSSIQK
ncbi:MAG: hypothetical protein LBR68_03415 [Lachnoclostridium sp.]|jgi:hypothetical protein|nr:hypothetical protein [Lachnoclostridium sp.]